mgnify:CR=1 FL=1
MQTFANIAAIIMTIVTTCSVIAMITPTPQRTGWMKSLYKIIDIGALNLWKAKDKWFRGIESWMKELYEHGKISKQAYDDYVFYKKAFWICLSYVLWDLFRSFGWL